MNRKPLMNIRKPQHFIQGSFALKTRAINDRVTKSPTIARSIVGIAKTTLRKESLCGWSK